MLIKNSVALVIIGLLLAQQSVALPTDRDQPIHISADSAQMNEQSGTTIYTGNVVMKQGSMEIHAALVELFRKDGDVSRIVATGKPANFRQQPTHDKPITDAFGNSMVYEIAKQTVTIKGQARVEQARDNFTGERIVYQMDKAVVNAYGGSGKVQMVIQPKGKQ